MYVSFFGQVIEYMLELYTQIIVLFLLFVINTNMRVASSHIHTTQHTVVGLDQILYIYYHQWCLRLCLCLFINLF